HKANVYTDHLSDLLARIAQRAAQLRSGVPVARFNRAALEMLAQFRQDIPAYAPDFQPKAKPTTTADVQEVSAAEVANPVETARKEMLAAAKRAVAAVRVRLAAGELTDEQAVSLRAELHAEIETLWTSGLAPKVAPRKRKAKGVPSSICP